MHLRQILAAALLVVSVSAPAFAKDARDSAKKHVEFGITVAQKGLWREAIYRWEQAAKIDPNYPAAFNNLAIAYEHEGQFEKARKAYERALDIEPDYPPALYNLGVLYMDFDKVPAKAKDFLTQYTQSVGNDDPKRADAVSRLKELK